MSLNAWIQVDETRDTVTSDSGAVTYRVRFRIQRAYAVLYGLFMLRTDDQTFSHVCTADELDAYPSTRDEAANRGLAFYRVADVTLEAASRAGLQARVNYVRRRLDEVVRAINAEASTATLTVPGHDLYTLGDAQ